MKFIFSTSLGSTYWINSNKLKPNDAKMILSHLYQYNEITLL
jgi:hypothetical protein